MPKEKSVKHPAAVPQFGGTLSKNPHHVECANKTLCYSKSNGIGFLYASLFLVQSPGRATVPYCTVRTVNARIQPLPRGSQAPKTTRKSTLPGFSCCVPLRHHGPLCIDSGVSGELPVDETSCPSRQPFVRGHPSALRVRAYSAVSCSLFPDQKQKRRIKVNAETTTVCTTYTLSWTDGVTSVFFHECAYEYGAPLCRSRRQ